MRPVALAWFVRHGGPAALFPDYFSLAAIAALLASVITLWLAARDGASQRHTAHAIACAYVAALAGGYVFEALRALPAAAAAGSWRPVTHAGRAAYGGLLAAIGAAVLYLRAARQPVAPFFDRVAIGTGLTFALVRTGCFLAGCDYGWPTASVLGVRFPPGSLAALDQARRGLVPPGSASLPVHPTQLYEAALGLLAAGVAAVSLGHGRRDGAAFAGFLGTYAMGRFVLEFLRGDQDRGHALTLSTAQWVSVAIGVGLIIWRARAAKRNDVGQAAADCRSRASAATPLGAPIIARLPSRP
ncbi:MAG TPA: prolipoprotein diacylglyceryl transferase family protein [Polyangia bacterium]|jgi:prolipoprotein diacylglyceryltransferase